MTPVKAKATSPPSQPMPPKYLWHGSKLLEWEKATIHISMFPWTAISAVFEGIRAYWNPRRQELFVFHLDTHLERLFQSMKLVRMASPYSASQLREAVVGLLRQNQFKEDAYIQPVAYFPVFPSYQTVLEQPGEVLMIARPMASQLGTDKVAHCCISTWVRLDDNMMPPRAKAVANYQNSRYVTTEAQINGYDYGIVLNQRGKVAESAYACIFIVRNGVAITPPVTAGVLESISRDVVKALLTEEMGIPVQEREVDRTELYVADEAFLCGTMVELLPVASVDRYKVGHGNAGPITSRVCQLYADAVRGNDRKRAAWLMPVYRAKAPTEGRQTRL